MLAEYLDPTFLTTEITFKLGRDVFELPYTCTSQQVHLYLNGSYDGVYVLTEHRQADPLGVGAQGRVKVDPLEGWFVELDAYWDDNPKFKTTSYDLPVMIKTNNAPTGDPDDSNNPFYDFIKNDWNELCNALVSEDFPENGYRDLIDMRSLIDFIMINEFVYNDELGWPKSSFVYKDKGGKISWGPLWDFDYAYTGYGTHTFFTKFTGRSDKHPFFLRFFQDPVFLTMYKDRWNEKYSKVSDVSNYIKEMGAKLEVAVSEDTKRWRISGGYWNNYPTDYSAEITKMKTWWDNRVSWLNTELNKVEVFPKYKTFEVQTFGYPEIAPQTFSLVAYGDMTELSATLQKAELSSFEISTELNKKATGNGGFLATLSIKPKKMLPAAIHTDFLHLSGINRGKPFSFQMLVTVVVKNDNNSNITVELEPEKSLKAWMYDGQLYVSGLTAGTVWSVYSISGILIYQGVALENKDNIKLPAQGIYIVQSGDNTIKVSNF